MEHHEDRGDEPLVVASLHDTEAARILVEDLEEHGIPPTSITLHDVDLREEPPDPRQATPEAPVFAQVTKSVILGGAAGMVVGAIIGALAASIFPDLEWLTGSLLGALFGSAVGGAAGGVSVVKYSSRAWRETYESDAGGKAAVSVRHADREVVDEAEEVMRRHEAVTRVQRLSEDPGAMG